ncbi:MAG: PKD domain-containing protein [Mariniphaga sp.]
MNQNIRFPKNNTALSFMTLALLTVFITTSCNNKTEKPNRVIAELNIGESQDVTLQNGEKVQLELLAIEVETDSVRNAIRGAKVKISVDGEEITLNTGNYNFPVTVGKVKIDCPFIQAYYSTAHRDSWGLSSDARFRLWPKDSPFYDPKEFTYPIQQKWFAGMSQSGNEPTYVDWGESRTPAVYYHAGFDFGGAEGMDKIFSATDGIVIAAGKAILNGYDDFPSDVRPDVVWIKNNFGWLFRYSHLDSIIAGIKPGDLVKTGQHIGYIGKQGHSGGWVHFHFEIKHKEVPSGKWATEDAYVYALEAYSRQHNPSLIAVARPHHLAYIGDPVTLDARKSMSFQGNIVSYEWQFCDSTTASGAVQTKDYDMPGQYSEILKVTDSEGNVDYDFAIVQVYDKEKAQQVIPTIHPAYHPTLGIKTGDPVTFLVRTFNSTEGKEVWNFGDGSPTVEVQSETVDRKNPVTGDYAKTIHSFSKPGHYVVQVQRTNEEGLTAYGRLHVEVENK